MAEYIDRGIAIAKLTALEVTERNATMTSAKRLLAYMPAADVAPVVRCKDCKQGEVDDPDFPDQYYCHAGCGWNNGDFYCAYGEREEGADNG